MDTFKKLLCLPVILVLVVLLGVVALVTSLVHFVYTNWKFVLLVVAVLAFVTILA